MIGEAYRVLSDSNARADYDRYGKKKPTDEVGLKEATEMVCFDKEANASLATCSVASALWT